MKEDHFVLIIIIVIAFFMMCKRVDVVEGLTNEQCQTIGSIPIIGPIIKSFFCPLTACNMNDDSPTQRDCLCNDIEVEAGKYCYTDKGITDIRDSIRDPCEDMECGLNSVGCKDGTCECKPGYDGKLCENEKEKCTNALCNNGTVQDGFVSDGCKCDCSTGWANEEGWEEDPSKICSKRIRMDLSKSDCVKNGLCQKVGESDSDYVCKLGYYMKDQDCEKCPDNSTNEMKKDITTFGSVSIKDCVCNNQTDYMDVTGGKGTCTKCPGIGKIRGIKNTGDPNEDCVCDTENGYLDKGDGTCVKCPSGDQTNASNVPDKAFKWDEDTGYCGCDTPQFVNEEKGGVKTCISNPRCMVNPPSGPTHNKDIPVDTTNKCNGATVKAELKELIKNEPSLAILKDDAMLDKYMNTISCDYENSKCICPDGVDDQGNGAFNSKCHGCTDQKVLKHSKSHDGEKEIDTFTCVDNPCIYKKQGGKLENIKGLGCFDSFDYNQTAGSRQVNKLDSYSLISIDDKDNFMFYDKDGNKVENIDKLAEICPTGNKCGAELVSGVGSSNEPWKMNNPCWPLNEEVKDGKEWWKYIDGKCVCTIPKKYRVKDKDGYDKCIPSSCWDFSDLKAPKSVCDVNINTESPTEELRKTSGDPPGCITTALGPQCQCKKGFYLGEPTADKPVAQCDIKSQCGGDGTDNLPEGDEKKLKGHWDQEELNAWLKGPGGSGIMQGKPDSQKARLVPIGAAKAGIINKSDAFPLMDWPKVKGLDAKFALVWSPDRTKLPTTTTETSRGPTRLYGQLQNDPVHPMDYYPGFHSKRNEILDNDYSTKTNEEIFFSKDLKAIYKTSYLDHKGNWIHKCDCGYKSGLNPLTNCKCSFNQYLDADQDYKCVDFSPEKVNCADRGANSSWRKVKVGDFYNLNNPKCITKGKGGYAGSLKWKNNCCVSCASKFYSPKATSTPHLYSSPPASGWWGRGYAWNNKFCSHQKGKKWGKGDKVNAPGCNVSEDLLINEKIGDAPKSGPDDDKGPEHRIAHHYADNGGNIGSVPPHMRQMMALGTNTRPAGWADPEEDTLQSVDENNRLVTHKTTDHYNKPFRIHPERTSYALEVQAGTDDVNHGELFKENVFYCKRTNDTGEGWGDEPVQIHNTYWDKGDRQKSAADQGGLSKVAGGATSDSTSREREDNLYQNEFYSFDPNYNPKITYPVRGGGQLTQWQKSENHLDMRFQKQPNDFARPNNKWLHDGKSNTQHAHPRLAPLFPSNVGYRYYKNLGYGVDHRIGRYIRTHSGWSHNLLSRKKYLHHAMPWGHTEDGKAPTDDGWARTILGTDGSPYQEGAAALLSGNDGNLSVTSSFGGKFADRRNPIADSILPPKASTAPNKGRGGWHDPKVKDTRCPWSHDGCQGFWDQGKHARYSSAIYQPGSPDDKNIGTGILKGVWVKRHDTYQKNCATTEGSSGRGLHTNATKFATVDYDKATIGSNAWSAQTLLSSKTRKGINEIRAECLGKPKTTKGAGSSCTLWNGGPATYSGSASSRAGVRLSDDICRDDDVEYGAWYRFGGYAGGAGGTDTGVGLWGTGTHQNWDFGSPEDFWSNGHFNGRWGGMSLPAKAWKGQHNHSSVYQILSKPGNEKFNSASKDNRSIITKRPTNKEQQFVGKECLSDWQHNTPHIGWRWQGRVGYRSDAHRHIGWGHGGGHHGQTCPEAHAAVRQGYRKKYGGKTDGEIIAMADQWCDKYAIGCAMREPDPRGPYPELDRQIGAVHPYANVYAPTPAMIQKADKRTNRRASVPVRLHNTSPTDQFMGNSARHQPTAGPCPKVPTNAPCAGKPLPHAISIYDTDDITIWKPGHRGKFGSHGTSLPNCTKGKGCKPNTIPTVKNWLTNQWAGNGAGTYTRQANASDQGINSAYGWGTKTIPARATSRPYIWHHGPRYLPAGQLASSRRFDTWRRSIRSFSRSPFDCPISPYSYLHGPDARGRADGAALYIPTGQNPNHGMHRFNNKAIFRNGVHIGEGLKQDIANSYKREFAYGDGKVPIDKSHVVTHSNQAEYKHTQLLDTGMPNGNCYLRGEGGYGDAGREGMGLCRKMTKDGPVNMSCCDTNLMTGIGGHNYASGGGKVGVLPGTSTPQEWGNMNCQVSPHYRTQPDPAYHPKGSLYDSDYLSAYEPIAINTTHQNQNLGDSPDRDFAGKDGNIDNAEAKPWNV